MKAIKRFILCRLLKRHGHISAHPYTYEWEYGTETEVEYECDLCGETFCV